MIPQILNPWGGSWGGRPLSGHTRAAGMGPTPPRTVAEPVPRGTEDATTGGQWSGTEEARMVRAQQEHRRCAGGSTAAVRSLATAAALSAVAVGWLAQVPAVAASELSPTESVVGGQAREVPAAASGRTDVRARARRGLRVSVRHPAAARSTVRVVVTGPPQRPGGRSFRRVVRRTTTWPRLVPGRYRVKARTITLYDQKVRPTVSRRTVRIPRNRARATSKVVYRMPTFCSTEGDYLQAWGDNSHGQLGRAPGGLSRTPVHNPWIRGVQLVTGTRHGVHVLCRDLTVWSWGGNDNGELGAGLTGDRVHPVKAKNLRGVAQIVSGESTVYALTESGVVYAWGSGRQGQLGDGRAGVGHRSNVPKKVDLPPVKMIAAGGYTAYAVTEDNEVFVWGSTGVGQRGDGTSPATTSTPAQADWSGAEITDITAGWASVYVDTVFGPVYGWGANNQSELIGSGNQSTPKLLDSGSLEIGATRSAGYLVNGSQVWAFGSGRHHDLGLDNGGSPSGVSKLALPAFSSTVWDVGGKGHTAYALVGFELWSWGAHDRGQGGRDVPLTGPSHSSGLLPGPIPLLPGVLGVVGSGPLNGYAGFDWVV